MKSIPFGELPRTILIAAWSDAAHDHPDFWPPAQKSPDQFSPRPVKTKSLVSHWHGMVEAYSRRQLTKPGDRILAISGIARKYGEVIHNQTPAIVWLSTANLVMFSATNIWPAW
jgi:hypothetical protein